MARFQNDFGSPSPTADQSKVDRRDENLYSSICVCHGGAGSQTIFSNPIGQNIPALAGAGIAPVNATHKVYSLTTTNLGKAGELGAGIGDAAIRAIGITIEQAGVKLDGTYTAYGATPQEVAEILAKCNFVFNVAGKAQIKGSIWMFPAFGGNMGAISTVQNGKTVGVVNNGSMNTGRRLKMPIMVDRSDTLGADFGVAASDSLVFSTQAAAGQETLVTVLLHANVDGDVR